MTMAARDTQRSKVYAAEWAAFPMGSHADMALDDVRALVEKISSSKRVQERYPHHCPGVRDGRARRRACYEPDINAIRLPRTMRAKWIVLHEMAHCLVWWGAEHGEEPAWHGWEFTECYLWLLRVYMGRHVEQQLLAEMKARRVRHRPKRTREMTDEQREAARQRMLDWHRQRQLAA